MSYDRRKSKRRDVGGKRTEEVGFGLKNALIAAGIILFLGVAAFFITVMIYNNNLEKLYGDLEAPKEIGQTETLNYGEEGTEEASSQVGKSAGELQEEAQQTSVENEDAKETSTTEESVKKEEVKPVKETNAENKPAEEKKEEKKEEPKKDPEFILPVEGEKMQEFATDKLVYSETLKEWVVHTGVDIKAEKTTVVKASEAGKVTAIKNDPRYGITVIIEHANGFETRYANLLTAEFVTVGEEVTKEQTIGTVGNTATFEILDDSHLHFEILKDGEYQDPALYVNI